MKRLIFLSVLAGLFALALPTAAPACNQLCGVANHPWGPEALCLTYPEDDLYSVCVPINAGSVHTCYLALICWNGYPIA